MHSVLSQPAAVLEQASISPSDLVNYTTADEDRHSPSSPFRQGSSAWNDLTLQPGHAPTLSGAVEGSRWVAHLTPSSSAQLFQHCVAGASPLGAPGRSDFALSPLATLALPSRDPPMLSPESLTVGQYLTTCPTTLDSPEHVDWRPLRRDSTGEFETESVVDGPIGLTPRVKPFIAKLAHLLARPESYQDCIVWDAAGESFILNASKRLMGEVFPRLFGHSTLASFTRQLNVYGFRRLSSSELAARIDIADPSGYSGWQHDLFKRGDKSSLHLLDPRPSRARQIKKAQKQDKVERECEARERKARATAAAAVESMARSAPGDFAAPSSWWGNVWTYDITPHGRRDSQGTVSSFMSTEYDSSSSATTATTAASPTTPEHFHTALPFEKGLACGMTGSYREGWA
ncbi:hypothetical protein JCM10908_003883 [Rhodotorula pacifica]|uniref:heat shock factor family protein n=1 Tax=Rhodotorula pacifica TaxID=1495444 RepID=UPI003182759E